MKNLVIKTEKIVKRGIKFRRILKIEGDRLCDLPQRYETGFPHCSVGITEVSGKEIATLDILGKNEDDSYFICEGTDVPEWVFQKMLPVIQASGHRLHLINEKVKDIKKIWVGTEDFVI